MGLKIDRDTYELIEAEDFTPWELDDTIEDIREEMTWIYPGENVKLEELFEELLELRGRA